MTIRPGDEDKMRKALHVPDAMTSATGSAIDPEKAAALREKADRDEEAERAEADEWDRKGSAPAAGS
ncbi:hypothetical protein [Xylophilus sp. GOD-11R]|uniref:hypothetical protein n=1 Tax=Xylophilus sp. GOD-11R TaxID=3089814 RepID=UPI00298BE564|nr:hypothetical protein [Xylophilus sp. GOD-11R]WPB58035.1 hypothetical protein R9X41_05180 [Xylophilus sp. GOD-11R]